MNIYIYGNNGFKKEMHKTLEHANIKFKLDEHSIIKDINKLDELKETIKENPHDIYLIDDEKIIKKNALSKKIKFLAPKDGIQEEFLFDHGIADISVDSLSEIPKYILRKHAEQSDDIHDSIVDIVDEAYNEDDYYNEPIELDDELSKLLSSGEESVKEIAPEDELIVNDENTLDSFEMDELKLDENINVLDDDNVNLEQDINLDDLEKLMKNDEEDNNSSEEISEDELNKMINFDEDVGLNNISYDYDDDDLKEENESQDFKELSSVDKVLQNEDIIEELDSIDSLTGFEDLSDLDNISKEPNTSDSLSALEEFSDLDDMKIDNIDELDSMDSLGALEDLSELDKLIEENNLEDIDVKNAVVIESDKGESMANDFSELDSLSEKDIMSALEGLGEIQTTTPVNAVQSVNTSTKENIEVSASNTQDIAELISKLLNNKTLEITIKIKD